MVRMFRSLVVVMIAASLGYAQSEAPLGDVARQKSTTKKAKRVVTDEDLPSTSAPDIPAPSSSSSSAGKSEEGAAAADAAESSASSEPQTPQQKLAELESTAVKVKRYESQLRKHLAELAEKLNDEPSEFRRNMYSEAIERQQGTLAAYKKQLSQLDGLIEQLKNAEAAPQKTDSSETPAN
jgi:uncharacterized coiled-coil protein SlyX